jgi:hypothetical protein
VRGLVWLRIALGTLVLFDLAQRASALEAHYTNQGVLPAMAVDDRLPSVYWLASSTPSVSLLFALTVAGALLLIVGWRTRWVTLLTWVLVASLQNRNVAVYHSGDSVLRLALFWSLFLPLGAQRSLDSLRTGSGPNARVGGPGAFAFVVQFMLVFLCALDFKATRGARATLCRTRFASRSTPGRSPLYFLATLPCLPS